MTDVEKIRFLVQECVETAMDRKCSYCYNDKNKNDRRLTFVYPGRIWHIDDILKIRQVISDVISDVFSYLKPKKMKIQVYPCRTDIRIQIRITNKRSAMLINNGAVWKRLELEKLVKEICR